MNTETALEMVKSSLVQQEKRVFDAVTKFEEQVGNWRSEREKIIEAGIKNLLQTISKSSNVSIGQG